VEVETSEEQDRRYERDRVAWNLPAPKARTVVLPDPERAPVVEGFEPVDQLGPERAPVVEGFEPVDQLEPELSAAK
jgi:glycerol-3-phosphate cytidylyltransferase-like family protein